MLPEVTGVPFQSCGEGGFGGVRGPRELLHLVPLPSHPGPAAGEDRAPLALSSLFAYPFIISKNSLRAYLEPGPVLSTGNAAVSRRDEAMPLWK